MHNLTWTGTHAELRWGYRPAAIVCAWTLAKVEGVLSLTGTVDVTDDFAVSQSPLKFVTPNGWKWQIQTLQRQGASLTAVLGPKE